ncbi:MerR family transcriptional regulator [Psychromicrobium xiongbiense]|uniref:MerR family transcriptional regulator n=1 Tax=Psychromicrobium xiongbiense TaxID=3051184 RepID=UPI002557101A|nr:MerR family transcriptional regulator [Psychromicrobium sp. YIM S02556]
MTFTIAQVAEQTGLSQHTLRYYERDGLMPGAVARSSSGHRQYTEADLRMIILISRLRSTGMHIRDIRRYAELLRQGPGNEGERLEILRVHRDQVLKQLADMTENLRAVEDKIGVYEEAQATAAQLTEPLKLVV